MAQDGEGLKMNRREKKPSPSAVLIDTPVWQDYFQKEERTFQEVNALMDSGRVCCLDLIVAELFLCGRERRRDAGLAGFHPHLSGAPGVARGLAGSPKIGL